MKRTPHKALPALAGLLACILLAGAAGIAAGASNATPAPSPLAGFIDELAPTPTPTPGVLPGGGGSSGGGGTPGDSGDGPGQGDRPDPPPPQNKPPPGETGGKRDNIPIEVDPGDVPSKPYKCPLTYSCAGQQAHS